MLPSCYCVVTDLLPTFTDMLPSLPTIYLKNRNKERRRGL